MLERAAVVDGNAPRCHDAQTVRGCRPHVEGAVGRDRDVDRSGVACRRTRGRDEMERRLCELAGRAPNDDGLRRIRRVDLQLLPMPVPDECCCLPGGIVEGRAFLFRRAREVEQGTQLVLQLECRLLDDPQALFRGGSGCGVHEQEVDVAEDGEEVICKVVADIGCDGA